jgi:hypothetical protein
MKTRNINSFIEDIRNFKENGEKAIIQETRKRNAAAFRTMINIAPIWTGNYVSNFHVILGAQPNPTEIVVPGKMINQDIPEPLDETAQNALRTKIKLQTNILKTYNKLGRVKIVNVCEYAQGVEYGQYPAKMPYLVFQNGWNRLIFK